MINQELFKEAKNLASLVDQSLYALQTIMNREGRIPNTVVLADDQCQFSIQFNEICNNLIMHFSVYNCGYNNYLLTLSSIFPQKDFYYPEGSNEETMHFKLTGAPFLGVHTVEKPIDAANIDEAVYLAVDYVIDVSENIIYEAMGGVK